MYVYVYIYLYICAHMYIYFNNIIIIIPGKCANPLNAQFTKCAIH